MKTYKAILLLILLIGPSYTLANVAAIVPKFQEHTLTEFTTLSLPVMPDAGTQLIFPFILSNPTLKPSLKIELSNSKGFSVTGSENVALVKDQNTITILGKSSLAEAAPTYLGNLYITVGGYNVSIALKTTYDVRDVVSNVKFNINEYDRNHLITHTIDRYKESLSKDHSKKLQQVSKMAREEALSYIGEVALNEPSTTRLKAETDLYISSNRLVIFVDKVVTYDHFSILVFEIENPTSVDFSIDDYSLVVLTEDDAMNTISGKVNCSSKLEAGDTKKCAFSTIDKLITDAYAYEMTVSTDWGTGVAKW